MQTTLPNTSPASNGDARKTAATSTVGLADNPRKRQRTACDRCKNRKQRCDNLHPQCSNCTKAGLECTKPPETEAYRLNSNYTKTLEDHVATLEARLATYEQQAQQQPQLTPSPLESSGSRSHSVADIVGLLSLGNAEAPSYIGSSSGYSMATNLGDMVQATIWNKALWMPAAPGEIASIINDDQAVGPEKRPLTGAPARRITISELHNNAAEPPSDALGTRLIEAYLVRIHPRFPFLIRSDLWDYHRKRNTLGTEPAKAEDGFSLFVLYMVYAIGALNLRLTEAYKNTPPEKFYISALKHVSSARESSSIHNVEAMVLLILYHFRSESHYGLWHMTGLAMRTVTDLGLHRHASTRHLPPFVAQLRRRLFWSLYSLEGTLASTLGRPLSLSDCDIDQPLPLSIDDDVRSDGVLCEHIALPGREAYPYTNMSQSILLFQLRRFESRVQRTVYRVDRATSSLLPKLYPLYHELEAWHASIPPELANRELDRPLLNYHKTMRLLLQPFLGLLDPADPYFQQCIVSAGQICQIHKRLHQSPEYGHSFIAVHTIFVSGITLLYCLWLGREKVWSFGVSNNLRACSCVLSIMGERSPWVRRYRDVYESLVEATMAALDTPNGSDTSNRQVLNAWEGFSFEGLDGLDDGAWNMARELAGWIDA
ncbi:hypothetical protein AAFC00_006531 [Neodothiora populina]|uniref:Zn(2)-C6 fungal-type domain-containing protein n=2 Tax=Neodothiora populina TaxID=2781224 RepID=A0ABR3PAB3_9PEZI